MENQAERHDPAGRRDALKKLAVGAGVVWTAPMIQSVAVAQGQGSTAGPTCVSTEAELLAAIAAASPGATITLCAGTLTLASQLELTKSLTISGPVSGTATLTGGGDRVLRVAAGSTVYLQQLTITGAGLHNAGVLVATNCIFTANTTVLDGGAVSASGPVVFTNCLFSSNTSPAASLGGGGAVFLSNTTGSFTGCNFTGNVAFDGGAIYASSSALSTNLCLFTSNTAAGGLGGGVYHGGASAGTYTTGNASFTGNSAVDGTAIYRGTRPIIATGVSLGPGQTIVDPPGP